MNFNQLSLQKWNMNVTKKIYKEHQTEEIKLLGNTLPRCTEHKLENMKD